MLIIVIIAYFHIFEHGNRIVGKCCQREVFGEQIRGNAELVESHEAGRQRRSYLSWNATLVQADYALILLAHTNQNDFRGTDTATGQVLAFHLHLV